MQQQASQRLDFLLCPCHFLASRNLASKVYKNMEIYKFEIVGVVLFKIKINIPNSKVNNPTCNLSLTCQPSRRQYSNRRVLLRCRPTTNDWLHSMQYCKHRHNQERAKFVVRLCYLQSIQLQGSHIIQLTRNYNKRDYL